ncbi:hypothetical protein WJX84_001243 [Apatococcus fuscideae]|uniref:Uncharacterized protein n=1 Tax=Apatococcus fuscideae TaxID=2026836 RepID=A0AAW1SQP2_9CHLO
MAANQRIQCIRKRKADANQALQQGYERAKARNQEAAQLAACANQAPQAQQQAEPPTTILHQFAARANEITMPLVKTEPLTQPQLAAPNTQQEQGEARVQTEAHQAQYEQARARAARANQVRMPSVKTEDSNSSPRQEADSNAVIDLTEEPSPASGSRPRYRDFSHLIAQSRNANHQQPPSSSTTTIHESLNGLDSLVDRMRDLRLLG